jgi:4-hydroxybenzoate polyprenyltransferase
VRTIVRLYLAWRLLRWLRPLLAVTVIAGTVIALGVGHARENNPAARGLERGALAVRHDLARAVQHAFKDGRAHR